MARRVDYYFRETLSGLRRNGLVAFAAVSTMFISVNDPDEALGFYRDALGLEVRNDVASDGFRWVTVGAVLTGASAAAVGNSRSAVPPRVAIALVTNPPTIQPLIAPPLTIPNSRFASRVVIT